MNKEGMSHIEIIASFAMFVGFLLFGLYFFNPLNNERLFDSTLYYAMDAINDNVTAQSISYGVALKSNVVSPVVIVPLGRGDAEGDGVYVEDSSGQKVDSAQLTQGVAFSRVDDFFQIRFGSFPYHEATLRDPVLLVIGDNYTIATSEELELADETRLRALAVTYQENYEELKTRFNIPRRMDFAFIVKLSEADKIEATKEIPEGVESFAQTKRVRLTREDGSMVFADMTVVVW
ncbi:MAG: hypothetical protein AABX12_05550 [Nanoarchaeota archaeon]